MQIIKSENFSNSSTLQLSNIQVNSEYCKEWNEGKTDFVVLSKNGELLRNTLYRVGGYGGWDTKQDYFLLLKYVEAVYDYEFLKTCYPNKKRKELESHKKHLEGRWTIIDRNGNEKKEFESFKSPYLIKGSCIYCVDSNYYNIETDEFYGNSYKCMESSDFLFLDISKQGIMKINKKDGSWTVFV